MEGPFIFLVLVVVAVFVVLSAIRVVREYERLVVFRWGRTIGAKGPGLVFLIPFVDQPVRVDLRELFLEIPRQTCITKDNAPISVDFLIFWKVFDPAQSIIQVGNFATASQGIATTTLRAVIGDLTLDDVLAKREQINTVLRQKLDEVTERWGVKVTSVEIREILPPKDVQDAMTRQMSAERTRRAVVTEADGTRESAIMVAEGAKQSAILKAEGERQAAILSAEGERQAAVLRAEGFSLALERVYTIARTVDAKTMSLQYLDTLKVMGNSPSTKFIFPMEFTNLLRPLMNMTGQAMSKSSGDGDGDKPAA